jgi:SRP-independent targeting protein 2/TMEM208
MSKKATKTLAARNTQQLNQTLFITLAVHTFFIVFRAILFRKSFTRNSLLLYLILSAPSLLIQFWFERISRPTFGDQPGEVRKPGADLEEKGLTEYMWDVLYWTYGCIMFAAVIGDQAWWAWVRRALPAQLIVQPNAIIMNR